MNQKIEMKPIAHIRTDFPTKFGIPRQSGLVKELEAVVVFEPEYRKAEALRGLEEYSHIWLIWEFSESICENWSPTVRPPRLGGNVRKGVFATRSPFRPNPIGLSVVRLEKIVLSSPDGPLLFIKGADLMDQTPIFDIKPYLPHVEAHPEAVGGFAKQFEDYGLKVEIPNQWMKMIPEEKKEALKGVLANDPRPAYQHDPERIYGFEFARFEIRFTVKEDILTVCEVRSLGEE
ncbi:MAG: tRNA (N6-threonylcarbamoyladenosine(37)-N6)-methyltransferase TrmO [Lachnospiraceae bacterium]|nr:tRNA (N6-threonylcarbamoyladenosine(37)-N6)-methyltransferase TrmO [Lachnospiraceae bacterium]